MLHNLDFHTTTIIHYPASTHVHFVESAPLKPRQISVRKIRDLVENPLSIEEFLRRPFLFRSRYLVSAFDESIRQYRQFYLGSSEEFRGSGVLRIGLYLPGDRRPFDLLARSFWPHIKERKRMIQYLQKYGYRDFGDATVGIFSDDLGLIG